MSRPAAVWRWQKRVPGDPDSVEHWESLIAEGFVPDGSVVLEAGHKMASVEVFTTDAKRAEDLCLAFGGRIERVDAGALMQPSRSHGAPLRIRDRLIVTESSESNEIAALAKRHPGRAILSFPPELAFGTGRHETTGTCLRLLADIARERDRDRERRSTRWDMLDLGHGTGILAIAAACLGASAVMGIDNDNFAVEVAPRNAARHCTPDGISCAERCDFSAADVTTWKAPQRGTHRYDVIAANLFADLLADQLPRIAGWLAEDGDLVVSGILHTQLAGVQEAGRRAGLQFESPLRRGKWIAMRGQHRA